MLHFFPGWKTKAEAGTGLGFVPNRAEIRGLQRRGRHGVGTTGEEKGVSGSGGTTDRSSRGCACRSTPRTASPCLARARPRGPPSVSLQMPCFLSPSCLLSKTKRAVRSQANPLRGSCAALPSCWRLEETGTVNPRRAGEKDRGRRRWAAQVQSYAACRLPPSAALSQSGKQQPVRGRRRTEKAAK